MVTISQLNKGQTLRMLPSTISIKNVYIGPFIGIPQRIHVNDQCIILYYMYKFELSTTVVQKVCFNVKMVSTPS